MATRDETQRKAAAAAAAAAATSSSLSPTLQFPEPPPLLGTPPLVFPFVVEGYGASSVAAFGPYFAGSGTSSNSSDHGGCGNCPNCQATSNPSQYLRRQLPIPPGPAPSSAIFGLSPLPALPFMQPAPQPPLPIHNVALPPEMYFMECSQYHLPLHEHGSGGYDWYTHMPPPLPPSPEPFPRQGSCQLDYYHHNHHAYQQQHQSLQHIHFSRMHRDTVDVFDHDLAYSPHVQKVLIPTGTNIGGRSASVGKFQVAGDRGSVPTVSSLAAAAVQDDAEVSPSRRPLRAAASIARVSGCSDGSSSSSSDACEEANFAPSDDDTDFAGRSRYRSAGRRQQHQKQRQKGKNSAKKAADGNRVNHRANGRCSLSREQKTALRKLFATSEFPTQDALIQVAEEVGMDKRKVRIWFQNQRAQIKRRKAHQEEEL